MSEKEIGEINPILDSDDLVSMSHWHNKSEKDKEWYQYGYSTCSKKQPHKLNGS